jgi:hypothetical protein
LRHTKKQKMKSYDPFNKVQNAFHLMLQKKNEEMQTETHHAMKLRPFVYSCKSRFGKYMKIFSFMVL